MDAKHEIWLAIETMFDAFKAHNPAGVEAALHKDCTVWDVFTPNLICGAAERAKFHEADREQSVSRGPLTLNIFDPVIDVWGDVAVACYYLNFDYEPPNEVSGRVRITSIFRRDEGRWLIVHHHEGMLPTGVPDYGTK